MPQVDLALSLMIFAHLLRYDITMSINFFPRHDLLKWKSHIILKIATELFARITI